MRPIAFALAASLLAGGATAMAERDRHAVPEAREVGKAVDCLQLSNIRESRVRSDSVIDFRTNGNKWYRNTLPNSCPSLGFEERYSHRTSINQLCSVDIIRVLQSYGSGLQEGAGCGLGKFQPIELVKTATK
jgi:hypothetical protein